MKTKEELTALKEEIKTLNKKLAELTEEELAQVTGGATQYPFDVPSNNTQNEINIYLPETQEDARKKFFGE